MQIEYKETEPAQSNDVSSIIKQWENSLPLTVTLNIQQSLRLYFKRVKSVYNYPKAAISTCGLNYLFRILGLGSTKGQIKLRAAVFPHPLTSICPTPFFGGEGTDGHRQEANSADQLTAWQCSFQHKSGRRRAQNSSSVSQLKSSREVMTFTSLNALVLLTA